MKLKLKPNKVVIITVILWGMVLNPFLDLLSQIGRTIGHMYSVGIKGDQNANQYANQNDNPYPTDDIGRKVPLNPIGYTGKTGKQEVPQIGQVQASEPAQQRILDVAKYQGMSPTAIPLPPQDIQDLLWELMPTEATQAAVALAGENVGFDPNAINHNNNGSIDYGLMQNNNRTLDELLSKPGFGNQLRKGGISKPQDVLGNARKSILASKVTRNYEDAPRFWGDTQGRPDWSSWYGWQNKGYNMFPDQKIEKTAQNPAYFKLKEYINNNH